MVLTIDLQPKQGQLYDLMEHSDCINIGYGGSRGGGKSHGARAIMLLRRIEHKRTPGLIFRRTYPELLANHIEPIFKEYPALRPYYNVGDKILRLPEKMGGGSISFGYAENPGDLGHFQGHQYMDILIDEATKLRQDEIDFLRTIRRCPGVPDLSCKMVLTCNPGGVGHNYIKRVMIDRLFQENEIPESFAFIPAFGWDNVEWARAALADDKLNARAYYSWTDDQRFRYFITRTQYGRDLNALPETLRIQHLLGRWDYFEGQVFPEFNAKDHNLDNWLDPDDEDAIIDFVRDQRKVNAHDHASTGISAHLLTAINCDEDVFAYAEYYRKDRLISEHSKSIKTLIEPFGQPEYTLIDPSTEAKTLQNGKELYSVQYAYQLQGLSMLAAHRASIEVGIDLIKEHLKVNPLHRNPFTQMGPSARLFVSQRRCPNLWREMSELQVQNEDGKITYIGSDHANDCLRYILVSRPKAAAQKQMDILQLPTIQQIATRAADKFSQTFGRDRNEGSWY